MKRGLAKIAERIVYSRPMVLLSFVAWIVMAIPCFLYCLWRGYGSQK